ncbi:hypothetical protein AV903_10775 [Erwinia tracheiphila]|uniref:DUF3899 domain-containing protein n=1 Tax=Erwinia tracheiphila TaxID=65700 RepID=A0A345CSK7_9GAMM|nr:hypothetical protein AV903_10775 [Erwinia tracheiphila]
MISNKSIATTALFFLMLGSSMLIISLIIYAFKRQDYQELVSSYREKYSFLGPCVFFYMTGFFGVFSVLRFFIKLSHGKKINFMHRHDPGYAFFDNKNIRIHNWMKVYSFLWFTATACYVLFAVFGLLLP